MLSELFCFFLLFLFFFYRILPRRRRTVVTEQVYNEDATQCRRNTSIACCSTLNSRWRSYGMFQSLNDYSVRVCYYLSSVRKRSDVVIYAEEGFAPVRFPCNAIKEPPNNSSQMQAGVVFFIKSSKDLADDVKVGSHFLKRFITTPPNKQIQRPPP